MPEWFSASDLRPSRQNVGSNPGRDRGAYASHFTIIASLHPGVNGYL